MNVTDWEKVREQVSLLSVWGKINPDGTASAKALGAFAASERS